MALSRTAFNPELEDLRIKALRSTEDEKLDKEITDLVKCTSRIHAAFLFYSPKALQPLLRIVGESNSYALDAGWQTFGDKLGLDISILKVINNNQFNHEDPVYNTLLHYVQYEDATVGKILKALLDMGRLDAIVRTKDVLQQLTQTILNHERDLMRHSHSTSDYGSMESNGSSTSISIPDEIIIKPEVIPEAPFIIKNVQATPLLSSLLLQRATSAKTNVIVSPTFSQCLQAETLLQATPTPRRELSAQDVEQNSGPRSHCTHKVMLTFAHDGADIATEVARVFRQQRGTSRLGVLILGEHVGMVQSDPNLFISAAFQQVNYVIPIITNGYLKKILRKVETNPTGSECIDSEYVPLIYQTMVQDYTRRGCLNDKVRCLIPDENLNKILGSLMMAGPLFSAWERVSQADALAERILAANA